MTWHYITLHTYIYIYMCLKMRDTPRLAISMRKLIGQGFLGGYNGYKFWDYLKCHFWVWSCQTGAYWPLIPWCNGGRMAMMMGLSFEGSCYLSSWSLRSTESFWDHLNQLPGDDAKRNWRVLGQKPGTTLEFRQQHLHRSILILGSSTNLYYSLLQKQLIRRVMPCH